MRCHIGSGESLRQKKTYRLLKVSLWQASKDKMRMRWLKWGFYQIDKIMYAKGGKYYN